MNVDLVDWPANPKLSIVPLLRLYSESLLTPLFSFYLFERIVLGVALDKTPALAFELFLFENGFWFSRPAFESLLAFVLKPLPLVPAAVLF
jgi:hypothetical protein